MKKCRRWWTTFLLGWWGVGLLSWQWFCWWYWLVVGYSGIRTPWRQRWLWPRKSLPPLCCHMLLGNSIRFMWRTGVRWRQIRIWVWLVMRHVLKMYVSLRNGWRHGKRRIMIGRKEWSFLSAGAGSWGNCNRLLQLSLLHLQNMHVLWSWTITLGNFVFRKNNWVDNAPIFGWQSGSMSWLIRI